MAKLGEPPSEWSASKLSGWLAEGHRLDPDVSKIFTWYTCTSLCQ